MATDPRDEIWNAAYFSYYQTYYAEIVEDALIGRWSYFDHVTKIAAAVTSGSSAVAGWALWKHPDYSWVWPLLTTASALLVIFAKQLTVAEKLRDHPNSRIVFSTLRIDLESFRVKMRINPEFPIESFQDELLGFRKRYANEIKRLKHDVLLTQSLREKCQVELNNRVKE
ncbi:hypothetical protein HBDW_43380 [Herbaspirillum sp. DW155]|uniref:hypothetical protein n=1 Tax=Herbaspirillum sp. DW155 TaxID=3095609 RepID=UPI0030873D70|nr:hypothetical protein HBDW_43380 [Herbaspirillum sp. DW155]